MLKDFPGSPSHMEPMVHCLASRPLSDAFRIEPDSDGLQMGFQFELFGCLFQGQFESLETFTISGKTQ